MTQATLTHSEAVQLDGSGNGTVAFGPLSAREVWRPAIVHVSVSTNVKEAVCDIFVGDSPNARNFRDNTFSGSSGDSSDRVSSDVIKVGSKIYAVWQGGDAGAYATLAVTGVKDV